MGMFRRTMAIRTPLSDIQRRLTWFLAALFAIASIGTLGYMVIEGWSLTESFYMTVITLSTVGFSEVRELSSTGRLFTTGLIVAGVAAVAYVFSAFGQYVISGELTGTIRSRRMQQRIDALNKHYLICGYGRVGQQVARDLQNKGQQCVIIERHESELADADPDLLRVIGAADDDEVLKRAGIDRAAGLVAATGDDPTNLYVTLSAHTLNPQAVIVARANDPAAEPKLLRAGASHVISPYTISGRRIATQLLYPSLTDFLDVVMHSGTLELWLEECIVWAGSDLHNKTVAEASVRSRYGANVLAVRRARAGGGIVTNPPADLRFEPGDVLIALGTREQLAALNRAGEVEI